VVRKIKDEEITFQILVKFDLGLKMGKKFHIDKSKN